MPRICAPPRRAGAVTSRRIRSAAAASAPVPPLGVLVEVTVRTVQRRLLLRPSARLNDLVVGVIGRAPER